MKCWQVSEYGEPNEVLKQADKEPPTPGSGELLLEVNVAAFGLPDVLMCRNSYLFSPELPFTPGQEVVGKVLAAGEHCQTAVGSRVMAVTAFYNGHGGLAEKAIVLDASAFAVPDGMSDAEAAGFTIPFHTAFVGLVTRAKLEPGETVLVHGAAGGSGIAAVQLAHALGATVIACASSEEKLQLCEQSGADILINHRELNVRDAVMEATGGAGVNIVYDPVGGDTFTDSLHYMANEGRVLAIGLASGDWGQASTGLAVIKNCSVMGVYVGAYGQDHMSAAHDELTTLYAEGKITPAVDECIAFADIAIGLQRLADRKVRGKLVAKIS
ncbi:MAG: NADPH:quinone oxidoreductase family protein [Pseudomonadales bacterium]